MDSYIEKRRQAIKNLHINMMIKYSLCVFLLFSLPIWISAMHTQPNPDTWHSLDTVCTEVGVDRSGETPYAYIIGEDGTRFLFDPNIVSADKVSGGVSTGDECSLMYADFGKSENKYAKALSVDGKILLDEQTSVEYWESSRQKSLTAIAGTIAAAAVSALLINRIWCKNDHAEVRRLRDEIQKREEKKRK